MKTPPKTKRLGEVAILSNAQKTTQRVKENEETEEYVANNKNKMKLQKQTLMKWR